MLTYAKAEGRYVPERLLKQLSLFSECDLKVYLTLLFKTRLPGEKVSARLDELAELLGFTQKSIRRSIARWQGFGLLAVDNEHSSAGLKIIQLLIPSRSIEDIAKSISQTNGDSNPNDQKRTSKASTVESRKSPTEHQSVSDGSPSTNGPSISGRNLPSNILRFAPKDRKDLLASDIAKAFQDESHLPMFRHFCQTLDEQIIRRAFGEARQTQEKDIKKSRTALFIYLIRKYAYGKTDENPGN